MVFIILAALIGLASGLFCAFYFRPFKAALLIAVFALALWPETSDYLAGVFKSVKSGGFFPALQMAFEKLPAFTQQCIKFIPPGFILGLIAAGMIKPRLAAGKAENPRRRKKRILADYGMTEFK